MSTRSRASLLDQGSDDMDLYQKLAHETAVYPTAHGLTYLILGLNSEAGEIAEKYKRAIRDNAGIVTDDLEAKIRDEIGDMLWYISELSEFMEFKLSDIAKENLDKLEGRQQRNTLHGEAGDR